MMQIYRKDNKGFWKDINIKQRAFISEQQGASQQMDTSDNSGDGSMFASGWASDKLSYAHMRNVMDTMKQFSSSGRQSGRGRFTLMGAGAGSLFGSSRRLSLSSLGKQNSMNSLVDGDNSVSNLSSAPPQRSCLKFIFCCFCCCGPKQKPPMSKLNAVLSQYDESAENVLGTTPLYPGGSVRRKSKIPFVDSPDNVADSVAATNGASETSIKRRVSFSAKKITIGKSQQFGSGKSADNGSIKSGATGDVGVAAGAGAFSSGRKGSNKVFPSTGSVSSLGNDSDKNKKGASTNITNAVLTVNIVQGNSAALAKAGAKAARTARNNAKMSKPTADEELSDSDDESDAPDDRSGVSLSKKMLSNFFFGGNSGADDEVESDVHPKYCMCGCRRY